MQLQDQKAEIADLEIQLHHHEKLLDASIRNNEVFAKTRIIFHKLKIISERLDKIKKMTE